MSTFESIEPPLQEGDRTILLPTPGSRRPAVPAEASSRRSLDVFDSKTDAEDDASIPVRAEAAAVRIPAYGPTAPAREAVTPIARGSLQTFRCSGINPLVSAANPLLDLILPLRYMPTHPDVELLREQLMAAITRFEKQVKAEDLPTEEIAAARYALCTCLDETISSTPWGSGGVWSSRSLLVVFHNEAWGGEKFFRILQKLSQDPHANIDVLELMYVCLALGMEGRYGALDNGQAQLDLLRERLERLIRKERGVFEADLSPHWQGAGVRLKSMLDLIPLWIMAGAAAFILLMLHLYFILSLNRVSDPLYADMRRIEVATPPPQVRAPVRPAIAPARLAKFLEPEIRAGLVTVNETADRSTVTLVGDGTFASGSATVEAGYLPVLQRIGDALQTVEGKVIAIGHTDNRKPAFSTRFPSNYELSRARAAAVVRLLANRTGPPERYHVEGRGDTEPLAPNDSPINLARNRRVDIVVFLTPVAQ
jgi:type VI secretion system protein ImpK